MDHVVTANAGGAQTAAIKEDGSLWVWGSYDPATTEGDTDYRPFSERSHEIVPVKIMDDVVAVSTGYWHAAAIKADGSLWTWGKNKSGILGNGTEIDSAKPIKIMDHVMAVSVGQWHTAAIQTDGSLWTWGSNFHGEFGNGTKNPSNVPVKVMEHVVGVSVGSFYTAAIQSDGSLWTWGDNSNGRLGNGTTESSSLPLKVMEDVVAVCAGENITSALKSDGSLWTWGDEGNYGALGSGGQTNARYPGPNGATYQDVPRKIMENVRLPAPRSAFATSLPSATRYVPYSASLPEGWRTVDGTLPLWLASDWNLLSGLPDKAGEVHLTITDGEARRTVSLTVRENSDSNVRSSTSDGYQILKDMPDIATPADATIVIDDVQTAVGAGDNFLRLQDVYLNGRKLNGGKLTPGQTIPAAWEYYAERGSSRITVLEQTLAAEGTGTSTISVTYAGADGSGGTDVVSMNYTNYEFDPVRESDYIFSDASQTLYRDAIKLLSFMGHVDGFEDGTFRPKDSLTRAQAAKLLASVLGEGGSQGTAPFADTRNHWAEHFIARCAELGIVSGISDMEYAPDVPLTGYAWAKMLFCSRGFDAQAYGLDGANWQNNVMELIYQYGIDQDMSHFAPSAEISREEACQLLYNVFIPNLLPQA